MDAFTRRQLLALSADFYRAHAAEFDASRGHHPWPGWSRVVAALPAASAGSDPAQGAPLRVLDIGCGNGRLAAFLHEALLEASPEKPRGLAYLGVDANAALLDAARARLTPDVASGVRLLEQDFLTSTSPGSALPRGPFDLIAVFGVLHHVPGRDWRLALLRAARDRLAAGGLLALAAWQFAGRPRFARRQVDWAELPAVLGTSLNLEALEPGDQLLRFGSDPELPPRYCHQVADEELDALPAELDLALEADFRADGAEGDLNRYLLLRRA
jgi:SAM-dependent methyltransferase